ncbi:DUF4358 domain-containing protein [Brevibacillus porteri]|uniref:DUF4358 domain-containing protein n=1 Tax=Brevibacillus porteri TaxID=2126350 RepID=A0ABX5FHT6_9BACL|nr:DUF4358 domain-containing protein [Brevibacillus porteri]MED1801163.1 DUF4358 domain-containing protein [Brevibacillus porteri]MED2134637.1 DUF4358 domain-containing protein [Brevibacillus porteri]MED2745863.1 DUF4358 domain-containing protein [Brevibacillus porteri]MED2813042.1 DUF4358 domain-containing protein [Brevibacillus porteri]MED2897964.1 DUF4358 domain-containing protein [Brevibacillus porteri]
MKRFLSVLLMFAIGMGILAGCSSGGGTAEELSASEVGERIQQTVSFQDMKQGDLEKLQKLYQIETGKVEDFILYTASSNVKADELAVIKVNDASDTEYIKEKIQQRIEAQTIKWKDYRPEEYFLIEKHVLKTKGTFVLFAVSKEVDQIESVFDEALR